MTLFLTSTAGGYYMENEKRIPCSLDNKNGFCDALRKTLPENAGCLIICAEPDHYLKNDGIKALMKLAFSLSRISIPAITLCDGRNENKTRELIQSADLIILQGGHVPTQNKFFKKIGLKDKLADFNGVIVGISAGTMNCADIVYAQPEKRGEAADPDFPRYLEGLGLTRFSILPHFQTVRNEKLDGLRVLEDISLPDSRIRPFYALNDGSYILQDNTGAMLYGEAYLVEDSTVSRVCTDGASLQLL